MPVRSRNSVAMNGSSVMASAGTMGSGNMLVIMTIDIICPIKRIIAMYMNPAKCWSVKMLQMPQKESKSKLQPWKKKLLNPMWIALKVLTRSIERKGG